MAKIDHPHYAMDITFDKSSGVYTLTEPAYEATIAFIFEAARFLRDMPNEVSAIIKVRGDEPMNYGRCGVTLSQALHDLYGFFIVNKRDQFLYIIERSKLDEDGNLEITINPKNVDRSKTHSQLSDSNAVAYQMEEIRRYFDIFVARNMLPEFLPMINASAADAARAANNAMQKKIGSMPIRFVTPEGRRVMVKYRDVERLGPIPDLDFG